MGSKVLWQKDSIIYLGTLKRIRTKIRTVEFWYELTLDRSRDQAIQGFIVWTKNLLIRTTGCKGTKIF